MQVHLKENFLWKFASVLLYIWGTDHIWSDFDFFAGTQVTDPCVVYRNVCDPVFQKCATQCLHSFHRTVYIYVNVTEDATEKTLPGDTMIRLRLRVSICMPSNRRWVCMENRKQISAGLSHVLSLCVAQKLNKR